MSSVYNSSHHTKSDEIEVIQLIRERNWSLLGYHLQKDDSRDLKGGYFQPAQHGRPILVYPSIAHFACTLDPPLSIVQKLVSIKTNSVFLSDKNYWLLLHVACFHGASLDVIQYIHNKHPLAIQMKDIRGRLPLRLLFGQQNYNVNASRTMSIVHYLLEAYPMAAIDEDSRGISALERAIEIKAPTQIIHIMQKAVRQELYRSNFNSKVFDSSTSGHGSSLIGVVPALTLRSFPPRAA